MGEDGLLLPPEGIFSLVLVCVLSVVAVVYGLYRLHERYGYNDAWSPAMRKRFLS